MRQSANWAARITSQDAPLVFGRPIYNAEMDIVADNIDARMIKLNDSIKETIQRVSVLPAILPDSSLAVDDGMCQGVELSTHVGYHLIPSAVDHIRYLTNSILETRLFPAFGSYTLVRSTIETASTMLWLLAPQSRRIRLRRHLRMEMANVYAAKKMMQTQNDLGEFLGRTVSPSAPDDFVAGRVVAIAAAADRIGIPIGEIRHAPTITSIIKETAQESGGSPQAFLDWQIASGAAHGKSWSGLITLMPKGGWGPAPRVEADADRSAGISTMIGAAERSLVLIERSLGRFEELRSSMDPGT